MAVFISQSPKKFRQVLEGGSKIVSRFNPNRSKTETAKPTIQEKKVTFNTTA